MSSILQSGIKATCNFRINLSERLQLSSGVVCSFFDNEVRKRTKIFSPIVDWRHLTGVEHSILLAEEPLSGLDVIRLIKMPNDIVEAFEQLHFSKLCQDELNAIGTTGEYAELTEKLIDHLERYTSCSQEFHIQRPVSTASNLISTAFNDKTNCYVGLHIDDWEQMPIEQRQYSKNRICINLGHSERYLLFVNLSIEAILSLDKVIAMSNNRPRYIDEISELFFELFPAYPIVKLKVLPGEAYVAPTENMIHDGYTLGANGPDVRLTIRGYFDRDFN